MQRQQNRAALILSPMGSRTQRGAATVVEGKRIGGVALEGERKEAEATRQGGEAAATGVTGPEEVRFLSRGWSWENGHVTSGLKLSDVRSAIAASVGPWASALDLTGASSGQHAAPALEFPGMSKSGSSSSSSRLRGWVVAVVAPREAAAGRAREEGVGGGGEQEPGGGCGPLPDGLRIFYVPLSSTRTAAEWGLLREALSGALRASSEANASPVADGTRRRTLAVTVDLKEQLLALLDSGVDVSLDSGAAEAAVVDVRVAEWMLQPDETKLVSDRRAAPGARVNHNHYLVLSPLPARAHLSSSPCSSATVRNSPGEEQEPGEGAFPWMIGREAQGMGEEGRVRFLFNDRQRSAWEGRGGDEVFRHPCASLRAWDADPDRPSVALPPGRLSEAPREPLAAGGTSRSYRGASVGPSPSGRPAGGRRLLWHSGGSRLVGRTDIRNQSLKELLFFLLFASSRHPLCSAPPCLSLTPPPPPPPLPLSLLLPLLLHLYTGHNPDEVPAMVLAMLPFNPGVIQPPSTMPSTTSICRSTMYE